MEWLNYHHLFYFWTAAKEGSITNAAKKLHLAQPTLSSQLKRLEKSIGTQLFKRAGRTIELTEIGQQVYNYANEIFLLGHELTDSLKGQLSVDKIRLKVGVPDALPKLIAYQLLKPALELKNEVRLACFEGKLDTLLADLALHRLDIVLADTPLLPQLNVRAFNHLLGESGVSVYGAKQLADAFLENFPASLHEAPMLLPTQNTTLRRALEQWFDEHQLKPRVKHEFEDSAILKVFGQAGEGLFVASTAIENEICQQYSVSIVGRIPAVKERFYAISIERRLKHPAVVAISRAARNKLFVAPAATSR
ncbi:MAG: transcriptional activator NhaR [Bythopirellula sp.]|nr:transcriptional activator NhaR [Bythopirellula sp.]